MKGNNEYQFIYRNGNIILKIIAFTRDTAIHQADCKGIKGDKYVKVQRRKVKWVKNV